MTDRLERLLAEGPPGDVDVAGLAAGARSRHRGRQQSRGAIAFAVVAVAAVPLVMTLVDATPRAVEPAPPVASTSVPVVDDGTRTETWHRLSLEVPDDWGYGGGRGWCATDGTGQRPEVDRPGGSEGRDILCPSQSGYGLVFGDGSAINWVYDSGHVWQYRWESDDQVKAYPENSWLGMVQDGDDYAMVVTDSEALTRRVVDSAEVVEDVDANGCAPIDSRSFTPLGVGDRWSICRYDGTGLVQSELLSEADSRAFREAIAAAPLLERDVGCAEPGPPAGYIRTGSGADLGTARIEFERACPQSVTLSGTVRELTADVMYWALSPGWEGPVGDGVPLPDVLRR